MEKACRTRREQFPPLCVLGHPAGAGTLPSTDLPEFVCWGFKCWRRKKSLQFVFDDVFCVPWPQKTNESEDTQDPVGLGHSKGWPLLCMGQGQCCYR